MNQKEIESMVEKKVESFGNDIRSKIKEIQTELEEQKKIRKEMESTLKETLEQSKKNHEAFYEHDKDEMKKYDEVIKSINNLTETMQKLIDETSENTNYVTKKQQNEEIEKRVKEALDKEHEPRDEVWHKIKMTAVSVITLGIISVLGAGAYFVFELYVTLGLNNQ